MKAAFIGMIAVDKANREGRDVRESDLNEAHELLKESGLIEEEGEKT